MTRRSPGGVSATEPPCLGGPFKRVDNGSSARGVYVPHIDDWA